MEQRRTCKKCGEDKPLTDFNWTGRGHKYRKRTCKGCLHDPAKASASYRRYYKRNREAVLEKARKKRRDDVGYTIWIDSRASDRKHGRENGLTKEFIRDLIAQGCSYCGETVIRMTLDRIDNDRGHTQDNVVPACIRCNYTRKNMPYEAWLVVAKGMREAREKSLFGDWTGRVK